MTGYLLGVGGKEEPGRGRLGAGVQVHEETGKGRMKVGRVHGGSVGPGFEVVKGSDGQWTFGVGVKIGWGRYPPRPARGTESGYGHPYSLCYTKVYTTTYGVPFDSEKARGHKKNRGIVPRLDS